MTLFKIKSIENFKLKKNLCLIDGICTEDSIYFTTDTKVIIKLFCNKIDYLTTDKSYSKITYDSDEKCFYATALNYKNSIFKLDLNFNELECIDICNSAEDLKVIKSLSYDKCNKCLVLSNYDYMFKLYINNMTLIKLCRNEKFNPYSIYSIENFILSLSRNKNYFTLNITERHRSLPICKLPKNFRYKAIICAYNKKTEICINILAIDCKNIEHLITLSVKLKDKSDCDDNCNTDNSKYDCLKNRNAINNAIESIALIETALSHILNAEGEKLQKGISCANYVYELIELNNSIEKTITKVTNLEIQLSDKLSSLKELVNNQCFDECNDKCDDEHHCEAYNDNEI